MMQALVTAAQRLAQEFSWTWQRAQPITKSRHAHQTSGPVLQPLQRLLLTDGVSRTLFEEYAEHQASVRGEEETGWLILGYRRPTDAVALATLPAGTQRQAGVAHVRFNSLGQAVGCRVVRQADRRLALLGVVHTHPGSMRHPSAADFRGDSRWVCQLRGREGIFGIGTSDQTLSQGVVAVQPKPHVQVWNQLCLSWYALAEGDRSYRPLPVELTLGPDLAQPLHAVWATIEAHAESLERLALQQTGVTFDLVQGKTGPALTVTIPLAEPDQALCLLLEGEEEVSYLLMRDGELLAADVREPRIDQGVYLLLAELASQS